MDLFSLNPGKYLKPQTFSLHLPQPRPSRPRLPPPQQPLPPLHYILRSAQEVISAPPSKLHPPLPVVVQGDPRQPYNQRTLGAVAAAWVVAIRWLPVSLWRCVRWVPGDSRTLWGVPASKCWSCERRPLLPLPSANAKPRHRKGSTRAPTGTASSSRTGAAHLLLPLPPPHLPLLNPPFPRLSHMDRPMARFPPAANPAPTPHPQSPIHQPPRRSGPTDEHTLRWAIHPQTPPPPPTTPTAGVAWGTQDCTGRAAGGALSTRAWWRNARAAAWRSTRPLPNPQRIACPPPLPALPPPPLHALTSTPGRTVKVGGWQGASRRNWAHRRWVWRREKQGPVQHMGWQEKWFGSQICSISHWGWSVSLAALFLSVKKFPTQHSSWFVISL